VIDLGRGDILPRAQRFSAAWPKVAAQGVETMHADLRYPNGFALRQARISTPPPRPSPKGEAASK
jgi:cell division septal protein FtsQ